MTVCRTTNARISWRAPPVGQRGISTRLEGHAWRCASRIANASSVRASGGDPCRSLLSERKSAPWEELDGLALGNAVMPHAMPPENPKPELRASATIRKARQALRLREMVHEIFRVACVEIS